MGHRELEVVWRKRRYRCVERWYTQRVFTERSEQVPPRHRLTTPATAAHRPFKTCSPRWG